MSQPAGSLSQPHLESQEREDGVRALGWLRDRLWGVLRWLDRGWDWLHLLWLCLKPARVSLVAVFVTGAALLLAPQGQDVARWIAENLADDGSVFSRSVLGLLFGTAVLSGVCWYAARQALSLHNPRVPDEKCEPYRRQFPRLLGLTLPTLVSAGCVQAALPSTWGTLATGAAWLGFVALHFVLWWWTRKNQERHVFVLLCYTAALFALPIGVLLFNRLAGVEASAWGRLLLLGSVTMVVGQLLYFFFLRRRHFALIQRFFELSDVPEHDVQQLSDLGKFLVAPSLLTIAVFAAGIWNPLRLAQLGPAAVLFLGIASWVPALTYLTMISQRWSFPVLTLILVSAVFLTGVGDNHAIARAPESSTSAVSSEVGKRVDVETATGQWLDRMFARHNRDSSDRKIPMFVVASAGGGSRASYWTATVLGKIQDENPEFANHLFAISSVSGGTVGAATFLGLVRALPNENHKHAEDGQDFTGGDFLSPQLANGLTADLLARIPPFSLFSLPDRVEALERARRVRWRELQPKWGSKPDDLFAQPFLSLWRGAPDGEWIPSFFVNATHVETGERALVSNLELGHGFDHATDLLAVTGCDIRYSTAVDLSSRFPYVSAPATIRSPVDGCIAPDGREQVAWGHVVDGGYFENFGAETAVEIVAAIKRGVVAWAENADTERKAFAKRVRLYAIQISSDPQLADNVGQWDGTEMGPNGVGRPTLSTGVEVFAPLTTLFATRDARGAVATARLKGEVGSANYVHIRMRPSDAPDPPLGRILSEQAKDTIKAYLVRGDNSVAFGRIASAM